MFYCPFYYLGNVIFSNCEKYSQGLFLKTFFKALHSLIGTSWPVCSLSEPWFQPPFLSLGSLILRVMSNIEVIS